jgi:hypothetical protein
LPQIDLPHSAETEARLPVIAAGLSLALARTFKIIDPEVKHPATEVGARIWNLQSAALDPIASSSRMAVFCCRLIEAVSIFPPTIGHFVYTPCKRYRA